MSQAKTFSAKPADVTRKWYVVDASTAPLGRLATEVATLLTGKGKPTFTPHVDTGDHVIVINADNLVVTGNKLADKKYYRHSGFPGGLKTRTLTEQMEKNVAEVIEHAIRGMIPANKLRPGRLARLKVYGGSEHNHAAQAPEVYTLKSAKTEKEGK